MGDGNGGTSMSTILTTEEAAAIAGVTSKTIRKWIVDGRLKAERVPRGRCQYTQTVQEDDLEHLLEEKACKAQVTGHLASSKQRQLPTAVGAPLLSYDDVDHWAKQRGLLESARQGDERAILTLSLPWEKGGYGFSELVLNRVRVI